MYSSNRAIHTKNVTTGKEYHDKYFGSIKIKVATEEKELYQQIDDYLKHLARFCTKEVGIPMSGD